MRQDGHGIIVDEGDIRLRLLGSAREDWSLLAGWLNQPHVREWWDPDLEPATPESAQREYEPYTRPGAATTACVIEVGGRSVGFIQFYPWAEERNYVDAVQLDVADSEWGLDVLLGEPDAVGIGIGRRVVDLLSRYLIEQRGASAVVLVTEATNTRAHRSYESAGFLVAAEILDTDTRNGERVRSLVMRRPAH